MKIETITARMLHRATEIYIECAYRGVEPPYHVLARMNFDPNDALENVLAMDYFEKVPGEDGLISRYLLRLGNERYPHMKLGLVSCAGGEDFVFVVDTHDRHFPVDPNVPGSHEFRELQAFNDRVKREIEQRWEQEGLPTLQSVLESYSASQCELPLDHKTVLVVEDEAAIAALERDILECGGYNVVVCLSGEEAIQTVERNQHIDLCLLDIMMPDTDGFDVVRILEERSLKRFPIVFVTAMPAQRVDPKLADGFIAKPFEPQYLLDKVRAYIGE
ncbi:MAG TPA: response regulator [Planctomycetota bacterium]|nr:response regulator [Planctomycetota bacterium]